MAALLIPLALALQTVIFARTRPAGESFLKAAVVVGALIAVLTEAQSLGRWLSFGPALACWLAVILAQLAAAVLVGRGRGLDGPRVWGRSQISRLRALEREELFAAAAAALIVLACLVVALCCPPNNFDSMTYHLPRVMHWLQNRTIAPYPANVLRQLAFPPGSAFIVAQLQILSGTDRFANCPQWLAFCGCLVGVPLIARSLGASRGGCVLALSLAASLPMAVLQAQTTQNDLLTAFWLVCFAAFSLKEGEYAVRDYLWLSASLGLAVLTKATGLVFGAPWLLVIGARIMRGPGGEAAAGRAVAAMGGVVALALVLSAGHLWRNKAGLGSFVADDGGTLKAAVGWRQTTACAMKNAALELPLPPLWRAVLALERHALFLDPEDPGGNFAPEATRDLHSLCWRLVLPDEDFVASPAHFTLLLWALAGLSLALWREQEDLSGDLACFAAALAAGFLIFCVFFKWQEWANRLMLPLFILAAPLTARLLEGRLVGVGRKAVLAGLGACGLFYSLTAMHRPIFALPARWTTQWQSPSIFRMDREAVYLSGYAKTREKPFRSIVEAIAKDRCGYLGLDLGQNDWEYAWWALLGLKNATPAMLKNIHVSNRSAALPPEFSSEKLCGVVESQGGVMIYFDAADMAQMHAAGRHEPPRISEIR